jgi:hypothetical protein
MVVGIVLALASAEPQPLRQRRPLQLGGDMAALRDQRALVIVMSPRHTVGRKAASCYRTIWFEVAAASLCRSVSTSSKSQSRNAMIFGNDRVALGQTIQ